MVYDSDFYTTRRPYRASPAYSSYTTSYEPFSRQVRIFPGLGKVHIVHSYDRIVPYVGHKRLTVVTSPPKVFSTRPSVLQREYDWIERKVRPSVGYSATNRYLNSDSAVRISYSSYPISSSYYSTLSLLPSTTSYYPKIYRWYYTWPRNYSYYYNNYYWPSSRYFSTYWPNYRSYLNGVFRNYYLNHPLSSYYRSLLDYKFSDLELKLKINNLSRMIYLNYPYRTLDYYPDSTKYYRPLTLYYNYYYPIRGLNYYSDVWPYYPYYRYLYYKYTLPSDRYYHLKGIFDNETSVIRAQTAALLRKIHDPVPRVQRLSWPSSPASRYYNDPIIPARYGSEYVYKTLVSSPLNYRANYTTYHTEPVRHYIGTGHLASVKYAGGRAYDRRPYLYLYENPLQSDIQLLSYYINKFKQEKTYGGDSTKALSPARPSRRFGSNKGTEEDVKQQEELRNLRAAREARLAFIHEEEKIERISGSKDVDNAVKAKKEKEELARIAEEIALVEEHDRQEAARAKDEAKKAELARQDELASIAAAERAAELEKQAAEAKKEAEAEKKKLAKEAKQAAEKKRKEEEAERKRQENEAEKKRLEEQRQIEEAKAEEAYQAQLRLEEIARKAEEEREAELARQAEELAELARQEAELAQQAKRDAEADELQRQETELAELERQAQQLAEAEAELSQDAVGAEIINKNADEEQAELEREQAELEELERAQAELDALEEDAKAMESDFGPPAAARQADEESKVDQAEFDRQAEEEEELRRQEEELAELERAQAELDALEAEALAMESDLGPPPVISNQDDEDDRAIAEDVPNNNAEQSDDE